MISDKQIFIAQGAMDFALKNGCQACRISIVSASNTSFEYRNTELETLQQSTENKLYIELFVDGCYGTFSTNRVEKSEVESFIREGVASTRLLSADPYRQLPDSQRYYQDKNQSLDLFDQSIDSVTTETKIDLLKDTINEIYGTDDRIISVLASYSDGQAAEYMIASNGFEAINEDTAFSLSAEVSLKTETDARPESFWYDNDIFWADLQKKDIAKIALDRAIKKIGQVKVKSGKYSMILDNTLTPRLLSPLISAMYGPALQQKNSFLLDKLGEQVISPLVSIKDCPHIPRTFGARYFDAEGVATFNQSIIEKGDLKTYFIDTYNGLKMDCSPTISAPSIITMDLGEKNFEQLLLGIDKGIWITGFNGGNSNPTTGDFSFGVEGFLVENGVATQAIGEMNITGNLLSLWNNIEAIGNDPRPKASRKIPSLVFSDVNFSGL